MKKYSGFTVVELLILLLIASLLIIATMPILTKKKVNAAVNTNVTQCVINQNAADLTTGPCLASVNGGKLNSQNYLDSIIMYLEGDNPTYSAAALKLLGEMCNVGGSMACDKIIDRCVKDSTKCNNTDNTYDLNYYLNLTSTDMNAGRTYIESILPSYYNFGLTNIVAQVNSACCSTNNLNSACTIKSKKMCPRKVGFDTPLYYDYAYGSTVDSSGNIYLVGGTTTSDDPDSQRDINIVKLNSSLELQWQKKLGSSSYSDIGYGIAVDNQGNVFITGTRFSYGSSSYDVPNGIVVAKLDNSGVFQWKYTYKSSGTSKEGGNALTISNDNNTLFVTGFTSDSGSDDEVLLLAVNTSDGVVSNSYTYDLSTGDDAANDIQIDSSGNIYITGRVKSSRDILALKLNSLFNFVNGNTYNLSTSDDMGFGLSIGSNNTVYITGYAYTGSTPNYRDLVVLALNSSNLSTKWEKLFKVGSTEQVIGNRIKPDPYGNIIVAGYVEPRDHSTSCDNYERVYAMKLAGKNGKPIWQKSIYPVGSRDSEIHGIFFPDKYSILLTGGYLPRNSGCNADGSGTFDSSDTAYNYKMMTLKMDTVQSSDSLFTEESSSLTSTSISSLSKTSITMSKTAIPDSSVVSLDMDYTVPDVNFN
jgi:hypothetical protein